jgi:hypothetical protein
MTRHKSQKAPAPEPKRTRRYDAPIRAVTEILINGREATVQQRLDASQALRDFEALRQKENAALLEAWKAVQAAKPRAPAAPVPAVASDPSMSDLIREAERLHPHPPVEPRQPVPRVPTPKPKRALDTPVVTPAPVAPSAPLDPIGASLAGIAAPNPEQAHLQALAARVGPEHHIVTPIHAPASTTEATRSTYDADQWKG